MRLDKSLNMTVSNLDSLPHGVRGVRWFLWGFGGCHDRNSVFVPNRLCMGCRALGRSARFCRVLEQFLDGVIAACDSEIGFSLEWVANVIHLAGVAVMFDDSQNEFIGLIQGG